MSDSSLVKWNPRYLTYCRSHGKTVDQMLIDDELRYPGGIMCGFILWGQKHWRDFHAETGVSELDGRKHQLYDEWLVAKYPEKKPRLPRAVSVYD